MQFGAERRQLADARSSVSGTTGASGERLQPRERCARALAERFRHILGEAHHPAVGLVRAEAEAVRGGRRHQDRGRRLEGQARGLVGHLAAAALDQQDLEQVAMAVRTDGPVVHRGARRDRLDMDEVECLVVRRIAVEVKQRQGGRARHAASIGQRHGRENAAERPAAALPSPRKTAPFGGASQTVWNAGHSGAAALLIAAVRILLLLLAGLLPPALLFRPGLPC